MDKLKPCPFCGDTPHDTTPSLCRCSSHDCPLYGKTFTLDEWNHRPREDVLKGLLQEVVELYSDGPENAPWRTSDALIEKISVVLNDE